MSKGRFDALSANDRELILAKATQSVGVMRALWDAKQAAARQTVLDAGVHYNVADIDAFRAAVEPVVARFTADPAVAAAVRAIRAHD
jgi:TRAP-type C4-dicarboxylate transport system substrate-binding protein